MIDYYESYRSGKITMDLRNLYSAYPHVIIKKYT